MSEARSLISFDQVIKARGSSPWDLTNGVLYKLCQDNPGHKNEQAILAKINIIGRVYAAAIERRKYVEPGNTGDGFYFSNVLPQVLESSLDEWIADAKDVDPRSERALPILLDVHERTTELFNKISRQNKRSLASKYLHFHVPDLFFIFDSRAVRGVRKLRKVLGRERLSISSGDKDYRSFVATCVSFRRFCESEFKLTLSPRQLDNFLLTYV